MLEGQVESLQRLNILYDDVTRHYHVIARLTDAMAKQFVCKSCGKGCRHYTAHKCDSTCRDYGESAVSTHGCSNPVRGMQRTF